MNVKLIIGLGNPNKKYENTYHNVGALFAKRFKEIRNKYQLIPQKLFILTSEAYVNESGKFVARELKIKNTESKNLLIAQDDSDLEIGKYKFTEPGHGAGGHHGIESIQEYLKANDFWRLRIGIRPPQKEGGVRMKAEEFVLKKITAGDKEILERRFEEIVKELGLKNAVV